MLLRTGLAVAGLPVVAPSANAEVYCKSVGVPKGRVMRPDTPGAGAPGGPGTAAGPDAGAPGHGVNRGGSANRPGLR